MRHDKSDVEPIIHIFKGLPTYLLVENISGVCQGFDKAFLAKDKEI